ncbi:MAG: hypothetical protein ACRBN8_19575 [Nannocystales bacterium]
MNDDSLLLQLGALQRERDVDQKDWEAVVRGDASASRLVESRVDAGADRAQVEQLASVFEPPADIQRWVDLGLEATKRTAEPSRKEPRTSNVIWLTAAVATLAAALALLWLVPAQVETDSELPAYTVLVRNETVRTHRGDAATQGSYRSNSDLLWVVRPNHATPLAHHVALIARAEHAPAQLLFPPEGTAHISDEGVVELRGRFGDVVPLEPGRWEVQVLVGRRLPTDMSDFESGGPWQMTAAIAVDVLP